MLRCGRRLFGTFRSCLRQFASESSGFPGFAVRARRSGERLRRNEPFCVPFLRCGRRRPGNLPAGQRFPHRRPTTRRRLRRTSPTQPPSRRRRFRPNPRGRHRTIVVTGPRPRHRALSRLRLTTRHAPIAMQHLRRNPGRHQRGVRRVGVRDRGLARRRVARQRIPSGRRPDQAEDPGQSGQAHQSPPGSHGDPRFPRGIRSALG